MRPAGFSAALSTTQFPFARALHLALPPVSRRLSPGDRAETASSGGLATPVSRRPALD